ncbi:xenotropic and polytropic retrovirus receptor 1-like [Alosa alosa]|uniref:xenotropic and polytropic retrovirus receptor 1-like n=1 Tax=Alosa alosa TaxID=278164 RepID=UPI0020152F02|nr:xenotropic and polytropic retrovirus receptor 1-like [Alosa alosa]
MDWTLLQGHGLLRRELLYTHEALYYGGMLLDVVLRVCWAVNILLAQMRDSVAAASVSSVLAPLEVLRRCVWNMFRLESEQLRNCELMRAVRDVDFPESCACLPEHVLQEWRQNQNQEETGPGQQNQNLDCCRTPSDHSCTALLLTCLNRVHGEALSVEDSTPEDSEWDRTWIEKKMLDTQNVENDPKNRDVKCAML